MLDSNTNKVTWVSIAVGIIAILGIATSQLYPQAFDKGSSQVRNVSMQTVHNNENMLLDPATGQYSALTIDTPLARRQEHSADYKMWRVEIPAHSKFQGWYTSVDMYKNWYIGDRWTIKANIKADSPGVTFSDSSGMYLETSELHKTNAPANGAVSTTAKDYVAQGMKNGAQNYTGKPLGEKRWGQPYGPESNAANNMVIFFNNDTDHSIWVTISDIQLYRGWVD